MKRPFTYYSYLLKGKRRLHIIQKIDAIPLMEKMNHRFAGRNIEPMEQVQREIAEDIRLGRPFVAGRLGANEVANMRSFEFDDKRVIDVNRQLLCQGSGFFPDDQALMPRFYEEMIRACKNTDYLAGWFQPFEDYYLNTVFPKDMHLTYLHFIDPFHYPEHPWTEALEGKKVLVIHPQAEVILEQYEKKRERIFPGTNILPEFEIHVQKAVQVAFAGATDDRYQNWFEALEDMYQKAMQVDFDVAILGCGAYGLPLAAKIKDAGRQAVHMGGTTQILFGIRGKRWDEDKNHQFLNQYYSDAWVRPGAKDKPKDADKVENGCYW
ncbi:MAG: hypothetical protein PUB98_07275 [Clostridiales bacterium]|nr:hypothetical protein [Clostridiales bacterium]